jgi:hypothetical protein
MGAIEMYKQMDVVKIGTLAEFVAMDDNEWDTTKIALDVDPRSTFVVSEPESHFVYRTHNTTSVAFNAGGRWYVHQAVVFENTFRERYVIADVENW